MNIPTYLQTNKTRQIYTYILFQYTDRNAAIEIVNYMKLYLNLNYFIIPYFSNNSPKHIASYVTSHRCLSSAIIIITLYNIYVLQFLQTIIPTKYTHSVNLTYIQPPHMCGICPTYAYVSFTQSLGNKYILIV